ncbi:MAG: hypothetical protein KJZ86_19710 [Caldilineaceae bacterium]|nr:hypothetical protein [Caldilineaceae bacterium]HRJ41491.1 hypothetical protein [Caldilineaceae bacterium]
MAAPSLPDNRARILLQAGYAYEGKWSVVQWQGGDGIWHDVEGWRGQIVGGQVHWGVVEKDFATDPFRWLVYDRAGGQLITTSASFALPDSITHVVTVSVLPVAGE